jgi:putative DNA primase/helicase
VCKILLEDGFVVVHNDIYRANGKVDDLMFSTYVQKTFVEPFFNTNWDYQTRKLVNSAKNNLRIRLPRPDESKIHVKNGTLLSQRKALHLQKKKNLPLNELNVEYDPSKTDCPVWIKIIYRGSITKRYLTLQEFCGYCLIPHSGVKRLCSY